MTVRFKRQSEYQRSFGVSRSRSLSPQRCAPLAGLRSDRFGVSREPGLQHRKRPGPGVVSRVFASRPSDSVHFPSHSHAKTHRKEPSAASRSRSALKKESFSDPKPITPPDPGSTAEPKTPDGPRPAADSGPAVNSEPPAGQGDARKSVKPRSFQPDRRPLTAAPDGQHPLANKGEHALRWKSGFRGQRSEYHREFNWKKAVPAASPILTAEQVLYKTSRSVPPFKKNPIPLETEYRRSFKGLVPPTGPRLRKHLEHQQVPLFYMQKAHKRKKVESEKRPRQAVDVTQTDDTWSPSPLKAPPPPPAQRRHRIPEEDAATDGDAPQVKELREKASSYRRRAWGTNFSRDHLNQLQSEQNALWEPTDTTDSATDPPSSRPTSDLCQEPDSCSTSCLEALDLASCSSRRSSVVGSAGLHQQNKAIPDNPPTKAQTPPSPAGRRTAWGEEQQEEEEDEQNMDDEKGRLPTPTLKMRPVQRTHHDLTTPATGGAIIVGKLKGSDESFNHQIGGSAVSMEAGIDTAADIPIKHQNLWSDNNHTHSKASGSSPERKQDSKPIRMKQRTLSSLAQPSLVSSPLHGIHGTLRHPDFQHNGELGLRFRELQSSGGGCGSDEDDRLSVMSWRSAASCSMASAVLERAHKRRENFWGKR